MCHLPLTAFLQLRLDFTFSPVALVKTALVISFISLFLHLLLLTFFNPEKKKKVAAIRFTLAGLLEFDLGSVDSQQQGPGFQSLPASPRVGSLSVECLFFLHVSDL